ncbi:MAG TPA: hypothetical protein VJ955_03270 [Desulfuromonadales bacterium]|nr:hypothetical protein [Desulfuromonadales bacterium]
MKNLLIEIPAIAPCFSDPELPAFMFGTRYFSVSRPGVETHIHRSRVDGYRLVYQLLSRQPIAPPQPPGQRRQCRSTEDPLLHRLFLSIVNPRGEHVRCSQVIFTLIGANGRQRLTQARPCAEGHMLIFEWNFPDTLRIETEAIVDRRFVTDHFVLTPRDILS